MSYLGLSTPLILALWQVMEYLFSLSLTDKHASLIKAESLTNVCVPSMCPWRPGIGLTGAGVTGGS